MALDPKLRRSRAQERGTAETYRGSRTIGSGNRWYSKGDVRTEEWLIECKRTDNKRSITLKFDDLMKIRSEALASGRSAALEFELNGRSWVVIERDDFVAATGEAG